MTMIRGANPTQDPRLDNTKLIDQTWLVADTDDDDMSRLTSRMADVAAEVESLRTTIEHQPYIYPTEIIDLGNAAYNLARPLSIIIEEYREEEVTIARWPEVEVFGEGHNPSTAIQELKKAILDLYDELVNGDPSLLGDLPLAWRRILSKTITR